MNYFKRILLMLAVIAVSAMPFSVNVDNVFADESGHTGIEEDAHVTGEGFAEYDIFEFQEKHFSLAERLAGDILIASNQVDIHENVVGDVMALTDKFNFTSEIEGALVVLGDTITIDGVVDGNVYIAGSKIHVTEDARILGRAYIAGENVTIDGFLSERLYVHGDTLALSGEVQNNVSISGENYFIAESALITGDATFYGKLSQEDIKGKITGEIKTEEIPSTTKMMAQSFLVPDFSVLGFVIKLFSLFVLVYFLISLWPKKVMDLYHESKGKTFRLFGIGLLLYIVMPLAIIFFLATIIGLSMSVVLAGAFTIIIALSQAVTALFFGIQILERRAVKKSLSAKNDISLWTALFVGVIGYVVLVYVPYLRVVVFLFGFCYGAGVLTKFIRSTFELKSK